LHRELELARGREGGPHQIGQVRNGEQRIAAKHLTRIIQHDDELLPNRIRSSGRGAEFACNERPLADKVQLIAGF
jgi:hypothetical protein